MTGFRFTLSHILWSSTPENLVFGSINNDFKLDLVYHIGNPSTLEAEAEGSPMVMKLTWMTL